MFRAPLVLVLAGMTGLTMVQAPLDAATIRPLGFSEMVDRAALIVRGQIVATRSFRNAPAGAPAGGSLAASAQPPAIGTAAARAAVAAAAPAAPVAVGTEGTGRMIFTQVDLQVGEYVKGSGGGLVQFVVAGGTVDGVTAWVPGLPTFAAGDNVLLFLRDGFERAADPAMGVNQGVFRIEIDPSTGAETLLNADRHFVVAIEADHVVARRNPRAPSASLPVASLVGAPTPSSGAGVAAATSSQANRFLTSTEPPMAVSDFLSAVTARLRR